MPCGLMDTLPTCLAPRPQVPNAPPPGQAVDTSTKLVVSVDTQAPSSGFKQRNINLLASELSLPYSMIVCLHGLRLETSQNRRNSRSACGPGVVSRHSTFIRASRLSLPAPPSVLHSCPAAVAPQILKSFDRQTHSHVIQSTGLLRQVAQLPPTPLAPKPQHQVPSAVPITVPERFPPLALKPLDHSDHLVQIHTPRQLFAAALCQAPVARTAPGSDAHTG